MELMNVLETRRSIRKYIEGEVRIEDIKKIIYAGTLAPSAHFREPWEVFVLKDKKKEIIQFMRKYGEKHPEDISILKTADTIERCDTLFLIYCNNFEQLEFNLLSIGAMIQNMLLQATELGIGSLWIGNVCPVEEDICSFLGIDSDGKKLVSAVAFGYFEQKPKPLDRKSVTDITKYVF